MGYKGWPLAKLQLARNLRQASVRPHPEDHDSDMAGAEDKHLGVLMPTQPNSILLQNAASYTHKKNLLLQKQGCNFWGHKTSRRAHTVTRNQREGVLFDSQRP